MPLGIFSLPRSLVPDTQPLRWSLERGLPLVSIAYPSHMSYDGCTLGGNLSAAIDCFGQEMLT